MARRRKHKRRYRRNPWMPASKAGKWGVAALGAALGGFALYRANENYGLAQFHGQGASVALQLTQQGQDASALVAEEQTSEASAQRAALMYGALGLLGVGVAGIALWSLK